MNISVWICIFLPLLIFYMQKERQKKVIRMQQISLKKNKKEKETMLELVKSFIGKECLIYTMSSQLTGTIKEVTESWILVDNGKTVEVVNADYIVRIREYPTGKKGKKKSFVID